MLMKCYESFKIKCKILLGEKKYIREVKLRSKDIKIVHNDLVKVEAWSQKHCVQISLFTFLSAKMV